MSAGEDGGHEPKRSTSSISPRIAQPHIVIQATRKLGPTRAYPCAPAVRSAPYPGVLRARRVARGGDRVARRVKRCLIFSDPFAEASMHLRDRLALYLRV